MAVEIEKFISERLATLPDSHPDRKFLLSQAMAFAVYNQEKPNLEFIARANELRSQFQSNAPDLSEISLSQFSDIQVRDLEGNELENARDFCSIYSDRQYPGKNYYWQKSNEELAHRIIEHLITVEKESLAQVSLTNEEGISINELNLTARAENQLRRYAGYYRTPDKLTHTFYLEFYFNRSFGVNLPSMEEAGTIAMRTEEELRSIRNLGDISIRDIRTKLNALGLDLATEG